MKNQILVAGSINMDIVLEVDSFPKKGETVVGKTIRYIPGGKGANQAVAASRLGVEVAMLGKVGNDNFGKELLTFLKSEKLDVEAVAASPQPSGIAVITVDNKGDNSIVYLAGANAELKENDIEQNRSLIEESSLVLSTFETPKEGIEALFTLARKLDKPTVLNPAPAVEGSNDLFKKVDYLILNETELATYAELPQIPEKEDEIVKAAKKIQTLGPKVVIVTLGSKGALTLSNNDLIRTVGIKVEAVDTTAAGDCFVGGLVAQLTKDVDLEEALDFANRAAAISVKRWGASSSLPYLKEIVS